MAHKKEHATMKNHTLHSGKTKHHKKGFMRKRHAITAILFSAIIAVAGISLEFAHAATAVNTIYFAPSAATYTVGQQFTIAVREDSNSVGAYYAQSSFTYPQSQLQFNSISNCSSGAFTTDPSQSTGGGGHVLVICASTKAVTGDALVANVTFTALAAGSATLTPDGICSGSVASGCNSIYDVNVTNQLSSTPPATYTIQAPAAQTCPSGDTGTYPNCVAPSTGSGTTTGTGSTSTNSTSTSSSGGSSSAKSTGAQSITPSTSTTPITAPSGSTVQVSTPATVQPATIQADAVSKIQYYLNNKLVFTAADVPFAYHLDTTSLRNGTYTLKTVSYYTSGRTSTTSQKLVVKNPFSFTQFRLFLAEYAAVIIVLLALVVLFLIAWLEKKRIQNFFNKPPAGTAISGPSAPTNVQTPPQVFTPSSGASGSDISGSDAGATLSSAATMSYQSIPVQSDET
jgi:hypothetical protein